MASIEKIGELFIINEKHTKFGLSVSHPFIEWKKDVLKIVFDQFLIEWIITAFDLKLKQHLTLIFHWNIKTETLILVIQILRIMVSNVQMSESTRWVSKVKNQLKKMNWNKLRLKKRVIQRRYVDWLPARFFDGAVERTRSYILGRRRKMSVAIACQWRFWRLQSTWRKYDQRIRQTVDANRIA